MGTLTKRSAATSAASKCYVESSVPARRSYSRTLPINLKTRQPMDKQLTAQPVTVMEAIDAMKIIIRQAKQGKCERPRMRKRLEVIKRVLIGDI